MTTLPDTRPDRADEHDDALLQRAGVGDERAFAVLVDRHHGHLLRLAMTFTVDLAEAEAAVRDVWRRASTRRGFDGARPLRRWLIELLLEDRRLTDAAGRWDAVDPADGVAYDRSPDPWRPVTDDGQPARQRTNHLRHGLDRLSVGERTVLLLRDAEGWSAADVCALLGFDEPTQRRVLHRARTRLCTAG